MNLRSDRGELSMPPLEDEMMSGVRAADPEAVGRVGALFDSQYQGNNRWLGRPPTIINYEFSNT